MRRTLSAALAAAAVAACGPGRTATPEGGTTPPAQVGGAPPWTPPAARPCGGGIAVHLEGADPGDVTKLELSVERIEFVDDDAGSVLQLDRSASGTLDVAAGPRELALVKLPPGVATVHGLITLATGHTCVAGACVTLDACTPPLYVWFDLRSVDPRACTVAVRLDLARSVYLAGGDAAFLPHYAVRYRPP